MRFLLKERKITMVSPNRERSKILGFWILVSTILLYLIRFTPYNDITHYLHTALRSASLSPFSVSPILWINTFFQIFWKISVIIGCIGLINKKEFSRRFIIYICGFSLLYSLIFDIFWFIIWGHNIWNFYALYFILIYLVFPVGYIYLLVKKA